MKTAVHVFTPTGAMRAWATVLLLILGFGAALGLTVGYVVHSREQADQRWCALLNLLVTPQPTTPAQSPQEERGRAITQRVQELYREFGCGR